MTLCVIDGKQCECQPQDGVWCPPAGELKRELAQLQSKLEALEAWKESYLSVEASWDCQAVAKAIGLLPGHPIRPKILPAILELQSKLEAAEQARDQWMSTAHELKAIGEKGGAKYWKDCHDAAAKVIDELQSKLDEQKKLSEAVSRDCNETALQRNALQSKMAEAEQKYSHFAELANAEHERQVERIAGLEGKLAEAERDISEWTKQIETHRHMYVEACKSIASLEAELAEAERERDENLREHNENHDAWSDQMDALQAELKTERENGAELLADAKRYAQNADYWRGRYESK